MFGWRTRPDPDAAAAARRRLAAIAAQFTTAEQERASPSTADSDAPMSSLSRSLDDVVDEVDDVDSAELGLSDRTVGLGRHASRPAVQVGARWALSAHQVAVIALAVVAMLALTGWWVLRSVPHPQPVQLSTDRTLPSTGPTAPAGASAVGAPTVAPSLDGAPASTPTGLVVVDVAGKVRRPGIVELPAGARVVDALDAAGGARAGVDIRSLNLARLLVDGEQIVVGFDVPSMGGVPASGSASTLSGGDAVQPVDLNTATAEQLDTLPGVGPVTAQAILTWRDENGAFTSVDELLEVSGIGDATLADIAPFVYV